MSVFDHETCDVELADLREQLAAERERSEVLRTQNILQKADIRCQKLERTLADINDSLLGYEDISEEGGPNGPAHALELIERVLG